MSAADEAWQEWADRTPVKYDAEGPVHFGFMAGYRRALEDAADDPIFRGTTGVTQTWLRARAAAVAPRETKDNA